MNSVGIVFNVVRGRGKLINKAQSCWGADRWEYNGISAMLEDDGYTQHIQWGDRLECYQTAGREIVFTHGDQYDLNLLVLGLTNGL